MKDWNTVVSVYGDGFRRAIHALQQLAPTARTPYYNVLAMKAEDPVHLLGAIEQKTEENPALYDAIGRVAPAMRTFDFTSAEEFRDVSRSILREWANRLTGLSFHARMHRRGMHSGLSAPDVEKFLDDATLEFTRTAGSPARISFADPDAVLVFDTIDGRAGCSLWTRGDLAHHRLLRPD